MKLGHVEPVVMADSEIDGGHSFEIGGVELSLATRAVPRGLTEKRAQQIDHWIQHRYMGDMTFSAAFLEFGAKVGIDHTHEENTRIALDTGKHCLDMVQAANKCPDMFRGPDIGKLRDTGPCDLVYGLARRV